MVLMFFNCQGLVCRFLLDKVKAGSVKCQFEGVEIDSDGGVMVFHQCPLVSFYITEIQFLKADALKKKKNAG